MMSRDAFVEAVLEEMEELRYGGEDETGHEAVPREGLDGVLPVSVSGLHKDGLQALSEGRTEDD